MLVWIKMKLQWTQLKTQWAFAKFIANQRGAGSFGTAGSIIGIVLAVYIMAYTLPDAIVAMSCSTSYAGAGTAVLNIATIVLPILIVFACVLYILPSEIKTKVGL